MEFVSLTVIKVRERLIRLHRGQTMAEYALILGALALIVYGAYQQMGKDIASLVTRVGDIAEDARG